jgi:hypothetical protein
MTYRIRTVREAGAGAGCGKPAIARILRECLTDAFASKCTLELLVTIQLLNATLYCISQFCALSYSLSEIVLRYSHPPFSFELPNPKKKFVTTREGNSGTTTHSTFRFIPLSATILPLAGR